MFMIMDRNKGSEGPSAELHDVVLELESERKYLKESNTIFDTCAEYSELRRKGKYLNNDAMITFIDKEIDDAKEPMFTTGQKFFLYNILSDELVQISASYKELSQMIKKLIFKKFYDKHTSTDECFIEKCNGIKRKYAF
jgi:hypothetical protein